VAAALTATAGLLAVAAPASGWLRDFSVAQRRSPTSSSVLKSLNVSCPPGKLALGAGALVSPLFGNLGLNYAAPPPGATFARVGAAETDAVAANWTLRGRAFCARFVGASPPLGGAASYVKAVEIVRRRSSLDSQATKTATASCPAGKTAISGGGRLEPLSPSLAFSSMQRLAGGTGWRVRGQEADAFSAGWRVHASAICANVTTETPTNDYAGPTLFGPDLVGSISSNPLQSVSRSCPAGTSVVGGGSAVLPPSGQTRPSDVVLAASEPLGTGTTASAWLVMARETDPTSRRWRLAARALCAPLNGGPPA
jgi:hypothetical protein